MKKRTVALLLIVGLFLVVFVALVLLAVGLGAAGKGRVASTTLLEADFEAGVVEYLPADDPFAQWMLRDQLTTRSLVEALYRGAEDERVKGFIARIGAGSMGLAQVQEARDALAHFRASGKPAIAYAETFGEFGPGNVGYYLATAFDEIYLQPSGDVGLTGLHLDSMFLRQTLEKLGVEPRLDHRKEYKAAMNTFTESELTEAHRESLVEIAESIFGTMVRDMAEARGLAPEELEGLIDEGPFLGQEAVAAGLVDGLAYRDEVYAKMRERVGEEPELLYLKPYLDRAGGLHEGGEEVALIYGVGMVVRGKSEVDPLSGTVTMGSDTVARAFRQAIEDDDVRAIVLRIDSPGGSYVASDTIWRETVRAAEAGKPVIASMGNVAASGGYFVAMAADKIVAQPSTVTASIGVVGGKLVTREMWNKIGVTFDGVQTSENAEIWSATRDYDEEEWARIQAWLDRIYADFTTKVAEGRGLPIERVRELAKGRIWSGEDALELGLVDELGGLETAIASAREAIGLAPDADVELVVFPRPRSPFEALFGDRPSSSEGYAAARLAMRIAESLRPLVRLGQQTGLLEPAFGGPLALPPEATNLR